MGHVGLCHAKLARDVLHYPLRPSLRPAHVNTAVVALANKLARIVWAVLHRSENFNAQVLATAQ